ncbi:capsular polysaccharide export protein, LipB/KpsS family, partial [Acinetobacter faecalis]|nr:hypothetical protein [Acinetobacter faecalis]
YVNKRNVIRVEPIEETSNSYCFMMCCAIVYYAANLYFNKTFPHYHHHRNLSTAEECFSWIRSLFKRIRNYFLEKPKFKRFISNYSKQYYVFALQVHNDSQILIHSELKRMEDYIEQVIHSFALHADKTHHLVLKHHPMDRGYRNYTKLIQKIAKEN